MCGIAGVFDPRGGSHNEPVRLMAAALRHRGPDDEHVWCDAPAGIALGHTRLAILDLSAAGRQPMASASDRFVLAYNGEIYNHLTLRAELERDCLVPAWRGHSDTETLLAGFDAWGIEPTVRRTVGMFAFAVWDRHDRVLTLGRDRLGEKPLFYGWHGGLFLFGSELKALVAHPRFRGEIDRNSLASFMRYGYVPAPQSIYRDIGKLTPGTLLTVSASARHAAPVGYWSLEDIARRSQRTPFEGTDAEALDELERRLSDAVAMQQITDVPLGAFLSGGIDSTVIVALMQRQATGRVRTFTIGFKDARYNEAAQAAIMARHIGTDHTELYVAESQALSVIPVLPTLYDEPFADVSQIPTYLVSRLARQRVTVSLSGDGGDELFAGYNRYAWARRALAAPEPVRRAVAAGLRRLTPSQWDRVYAAVQPLLPSSLQIRMAGDRAHKLAGVLGVSSQAALYEQFVSLWTNGVGTVVSGHDMRVVTRTWDALADLVSLETRMMTVDALTYLPDDILCKVDRAAMGVSLETRVPFLDHRVVEYAWSLPLRFKLRDGQSKWIVRQLLHRYVPPALIDRPKMGFGVPLDAWLRGALRDWAEELLSVSRLNGQGYLDTPAVRQCWAEHLSGRLNRQYQLWPILMFQAWLDACGGVRAAA